MDDLEFRIAKLEVKSGDMLVAKFDGRLTQDMVERIRRAFLEKLPQGVNVLVLEKGCDLAVLTFEEIERRTNLANAA